MSLQRFRRIRLAVFLFLVVSPWFGCRTQNSSSILLDPDGMGTDQGTLISVADIRAISQAMIDSLSRNRRVSELRNESTPLNILVGEFKHRTSIAVFDKELFVNRVLAGLASADTAGAYAFLERESVLAERELRASRTVSGEPIERLRGAEYVLSGEVRELLYRNAASGGGELERRTVQYTLGLTRVSDGTLIWTNAHEIVKQQMIGAVYR